MSMLDAVLSFLESPAFIKVLVEITNAGRIWGVAAVIIAAPVLAPFIWRAFRGAMMAAWLDLRQYGPIGAIWAVHSFIVAAWAEGWATRLQINVWVVVVMMMFIAGAGSGIFVASNFLRGGYSAPALTMLMAPFWLSLSAAGWAFTISTSRNPRETTLSAGMLLVALSVIAFRLDGTA